MWDTHIQHTVLYNLWFIPVKFDSIKYLYDTEGVIKKKKKSKILYLINYLACRCCISYACLVFHFKVSVQQSIRKRKRKYLSSINMNVISSLGIESIRSNRLNSPTFRKKSWSMLTNRRICSYRYVGYR